MAGLLTLHSNGEGSGGVGDIVNGAFLTGHSWIEYTPDGGAPTTYGTWGNNPTGQGNGLFQGIDPLASDVSRSTRLTDEQEQVLMARIQATRDQGADGWGYLSPCSSFAAGAWNASTGEALADRTGPISTPSKLKASIAAANAADVAAAAAAAPVEAVVPVAGDADVPVAAAAAAAVVAPPVRASSRRDVDDPVQPCGCS